MKKDGIPVLFAIYRFNRRDVNNDGFWLVIPERLPPSALSSSGYPVVYCGCY